MTLWLAWVDPVSEQFAHWSVGPFENTPEELDSAQECIEEFYARQSPENPEYMLPVLYWRGDDGEPIKPFEG